MMIRRSFVVRIWLDEEGAVSGQISDPLTELRQPFHNPTEFWALMNSFLVESSSTNFPDSLPENESSSSITS